MQGAEDRRRLVKQHSDGYSRPLLAVLKCAAGIATLVGLAAGPWVILGFGVTPEARQRTPATAPAAGSMEESRRVFEERRQRFEGERENTKSALAK